MPTELSFVLLVLSLLLVRLFVVAATTEALSTIIGNTATEASHGVEVHACAITSKRSPSHWGTRTAAIVVHLVLHAKLVGIHHHSWHARELRHHHL